MGRRSQQNYQRVQRYPLGRVPRAVYDDEEELSQVRRTPMYGSAAFDDDFEPAGVPRRRFRQMAWRFIGAVAIGGAFYGVAQIAIHPEARREIAQWVTLGHAEHVAGAERTLEKWIDWVKSR